MTKGTVSKLSWLVALWAASGCGARTVATSNQQHLEQFRAELQGLEQALAQPEAAGDIETFSEDLVSRLDQLIGIATELEFATANNGEAAELAKSISATLNEMYNATEANPDVEKLRTGIQKGAVRFAPP